MPERREGLMGLSYDAVVVGSGPNGLAAAITLAQSGRTVIVLEAEETIGGGTRSAALTQPGYVHDLCATAFPLGVGSPFFSRLPLADHGLNWVHAPTPLAHPLDDGTAILLERSIDETARGLGGDADAYRRLFEPLVSDAGILATDLLAPLISLPSHPLRTARFGALALLPAATLARSVFVSPRARALFAGLAAHSMQSLEQPLSAAFGLVLGTFGHAAGWPFVRGGSQHLADALASHFRALGGEILTGLRVRSLDDLPASGATLFDVTPRQLLVIAGRRFPHGFRRQLARFRYGPGVFKVDWALDGPVPWTAPECRGAGVVHLGGAFEEIVDAEQHVALGRHPEQPFVLLAQPSLFDRSRAPDGKDAAWAYCHVPNGSVVDMTGRIEAQIERFAPGFGRRVIARHVMGPSELERHNANCVGGDIGGGALDWRQFIGRPTWRRSPYTTPASDLFLCSASTPPGGGVHGMCGYHAALEVLWRVFGKR